MDGFKLKFRADNYYFIGDMREAAFRLYMFRVACWSKLLLYNPNKLLKGSSNGRTT